jgi:hypothetical protein
MGTFLKLIRYNPYTMSRRLKLATRALGAEPGVSDIAELAGWIAEHRGKAADLTTYRLFQSLAPQLSAGIGLPCAGGKFMKDRILESLSGITGNKTVDEIRVGKDELTRDACSVVAQKRGVACSLPSPEDLGIIDKYYGDEDEWSGAITGVYKTLMRTMRDAGVASHVLICDKPGEPMISALADQKVFLFQPEPDPEGTEVLLEHQKQIAVPGDKLQMVFDLRDEYDLRQVFIIDPDRESIKLALSQIDPDQVRLAGYCRETCEYYWEDLEKISSFSP